ncbi:MAG: histidinol-phosphate transaminase [Saccharospirillaceae bacterium]|nr:histidinol-phosphate transaminase [Pseudomonadales bacterium]NRB79533.1 histidinol-phosphate transaminase [Saccharospirillaceae bacterium]
MSDDSQKIIATQSVQKLMPYIPGKPVEELERELGIENIVKLASNENPLGPSPKVIEAIRQALPDLTRYPDGSAYRLKNKLAEKLNINSDQITIGNGSNDVLELIARAFLTAEDEVIYSQHAFAVYPIVTQAVGAKAVVTQAIDWGHDLDAMEAAITSKTKIIFIANPNNPTGTWISKGELKAFLKQVPKRIIVVLDEAYAEYVSQENYPDGIRIHKRFENVVLTRTFSKAYGLASLRVGYSVSTAKIADYLNRVRQPFNVNSLALVAAEAALDDTEYLKQSIAQNDSGKKQIKTALKEMDVNYISSIGNFLCVEFKGKAQFVNDELLKMGVIVRPVANYEMPDHLRVTIGTKEENERFLQCVKQILEAM